jgi:pimeloyl-ACP methyl ester carboxylesterase
MLTKSYTMLSDGDNSFSLLSYHPYVTHAELHATSEAGRLPMKENPDLVNNMVLAFLESHGE